MFNPILVKVTKHFFHGFGKIHNVIETANIDGLPKG